MVAAQMFEHSVDLVDVLLQYSGDLVARTIAEMLLVTVAMKMVQGWFSFPAKLEVMVDALV
ncbi:hypothetical protein DEO72_LG7g1300 [Vigna unguiculata]|uniref:Uncharacterized protein n=1 Tax=Vigna unguiculata TaxID=3917 RepID=A0A4D6MGU9_VIGUN|nr:hypothetical protein DEO72_LG7g1300 [Vigna unguiculata]